MFTLHIYIKIYIYYVYKLIFTFLIICIRQTIRKFYSDDIVIFNLLHKNICICIYSVYTEEKYMGTYLYYYF